MTDTKIDAVAYTALKPAPPSIIVDDELATDDTAGVTFVTKDSPHDAVPPSPSAEPHVLVRRPNRKTDSELDSPQYIDDWDDKPYQSIESENVAFHANNAMVKTSPLEKNDKNKFGETTTQFVDDVPVGTSYIRADDQRENNEEWRHSTLCEYLRGPDVEARIVTRQNMTKQKIRWKRRLQNYLFNFLERPTGVKCFIYHMIVFMMVLVCLIFSVLSTVDDADSNRVHILLIMESCVVGFFGIEYCVRLWAAGSIGKYSGLLGRLRFARKPICLIDLFVVIASTVVLLFSQNGNVFATSAIRGIRFLQILRMLHMDRQAGTWRLLGSVVYIHRQELITTLYIGFLALILSSYFVYLAEKPDDHDGHKNETYRIDNLNQFQNYADALWWGVVTVTTIGYGDFVPRTWLGKVVASCFSIFAISFFALPAGILGSGFALKVQQKQRQKQFNRQIPAAANLIQAVWRCYSVRRGSRLKATWTLYALPSRSRHDLKNSALSMSTSRLNKPTRREHHKPKNSGDRHKLTVPGAGTQSNWNDLIDEVIYKNENNENDSESLPDSYKNVVRAVRVLIYLVRKKEFHQCRKPYDVRDVFEQYSHGYVNITVRLKELQRRLDQTLGKPASFIEESSPNQDRQYVTTGYRLRRLEIKVNSIEDKLDELLRRLPPISKDLRSDEKT